MIVNNYGLTLEQVRAAVPSVFAPAPHESRSSRYLYIPTGDILAGLSDEGLIPVSVMQSRTRNASKQNYTKHLIRLRQQKDLGDSRLDVHEIVMVNSHDGSSSYQLMSGVYRKVCTNGLIAWQGEDTLKVQHKGNLLNNVIEGTYRIVEGSAQVMETVEEMKQVDLSREEQLLLAEFAMKARFDLDDNEEESAAAEIQQSSSAMALVPYQPIDFLRVRRRADQQSDLYTTLNVLQENTIRGGVSRRDAKGKKHTTKEIKGIPQLVKVNRMLWQLSERMLELKQQA